MNKRCLRHSSPHTHACWNTHSFVFIDRTTEDIERQRPGQQKNGLDHSDAWWTNKKVMRLNIREGTREYVCVSAVVRACPKRKRRTEVSVIAVRTSSMVLLPEDGWESVRLSASADVRGSSRTRNRIVRHSDRANGETNAGDTHSQVDYRRPKLGNSWGKEDIPSVGSCRSGQVSFAFSIRRSAQISLSSPSLADLATVMYREWNTWKHNWSLLDRRVVIVPFLCGHWWMHNEPFLNQSPLLFSKVFISRAKWSEESL